MESKVEAWGAINLSKKYDQDILAITQEQRILASNLNRFTDEINGKLNRFTDEIYGLKQQFGTRSGRRLVGILAVLVGILAILRK